MPPVNDDITARIDLGVLAEGANNVAGTTVAATTEAWEGYADFVDVWYEFTVPATGTISIKNAACSYPIYADVEILNVDPPTSWSDFTYADLFVGDGTNTPPDEDGGSPFTPGTYIVYVSSWNGPDSGTFSFDLVYTRTGGNDDIADAITLDVSGGSASVEGDNTAFSLETDEAAALGYDAANLAGGPGYGGGKTAWYKIVAPDDGLLTLETHFLSSGGGSNTDTLLAVLDGDDFSTAVLLAFDDDSGTGNFSKITSLPVVAGATYWIAVDGWNGTPTDGGGYTNASTIDGAYTLTAAFTAVPGNDLYPQDAPAFETVAYNLSFLSFRSGGCKTGSTKNATAEAGEPDSAPGHAAAKTVWLTWDATFTGDVTAWLTSADPNMADGIMSAYEWVSGAPSGLGAALDQGDDELGTQPQVTFAVTNGTRYVFQIDTRDSGGSFTFHWKRSDGSPPANDNFANAEVITGAGGETTGTFATATAECSEPARMGVLSLGSGPYNTVWYEWTPPVTGNGVIYLSYEGLVTTQATSDDGIPFIEVFQGASLGALVSVPTLVMPGLGGPARVFPIVAGQTYLIRIDSQEDLSAPDFTLYWETDTLDWRIRTVTFTAGDTEVATGLGKTPVALLAWAASTPNDETPADDFVTATGAWCGGDQWSNAMSYPVLTAVTNGQQYGVTGFATDAIIVLLNTDGSTRAKVSVTAVDADGTVHLSWDTDPADGSMFGLFAISGVEAEIGTVLGVTGVTTETVTPTIRTRVFAAGIRSDFPNTFSHGASGWTWGVWNEASRMASDSPNGGGIEFGIDWFFTGDDDGEFLIGGPDITFHRTADDPFSYRGCKSFDFDQSAADEPGDWVSDIGWIALGGFGWHAAANDLDPALDIGDHTPLTLGLDDFWVNGGMMVGAYNGGGFVGNVSLGAFDKNDSQFAVDQFFVGFPEVSGPHDGILARVSTDESASIVLSDASTVYGSWDVDLPPLGDYTPGATLTRTGGDGQAIFPIWLGNFIPPTLASLFVPQIIRYR